MARYLRRARVERPEPGFPFDLAAVHALADLRFDAPATFLVGENGTGKSTLLEALALAAGCNAHGGSHNLRTVGHGTESVLHEHLRLTWGRRAPNRFFLRGETFLDAVAAYDRPSDRGRFVALTRASHGESVITLLCRLPGKGLLLVADEPDDGLSVTGQLAVLRRCQQLVDEGAQLIVATHSPVLTALPDAQIWELDDSGIREVKWADTDSTVLLRSFLDQPERFLARLLRE
ncbi:MAG: AAA family ATPase [Acidimicrobiales bacterium]